MFCMHSYINTFLLVCTYTHIHIYAKFPYARDYLYMPFTLRPTPPPTQTAKIFVFYSKCCCFFYRPRRETKYLYIASGCLGAFIGWYSFNDLLKERASAAIASSPSGQHAGSSNININNINNNNNSSSSSSSSSNSSSSNNN